MTARTRTRSGLAALLATGLAVPAAPAAPAPLPVIGDRSPGACVKPSGRTVPEVPWAQVRLAPERVWQLTTGSGVPVAVVDSGIDASHGSPLAGQVTRTIRVVPSAHADCAGHGTFVAGLIAARPSTGVGFAGLAPGVRLLDVGVAADSGAVKAADLARGIEAAADAGAKVIVVTVTVPAPAPALAAAVRHAAVRDAVVVAPATDDAGTAVGYPAQYPGVVSVGPLDAAGTAPRTRATPQRVDLLAPGDAIVSVGPGGPNLFMGASPAFSAAFVGGTAALVRSYRPALRAPEVVARLEAGAYAPPDIVPSKRLGYGAVDPFAAVTRVAATGSPRRAATGGTPLRPVAAGGAAGATRALTVAGAGLLVLLLGIGAAVVVPRGRARGWKAPS